MSEPFFPSAEKALIKVGQGGQATALPDLLIEAPATSTNDVKSKAETPVRTAQLSALGVTGPSGPQKEERK